MNATPDYDSPWKDLLDAFFEDLMAFFFTTAHSAIDWERGLEFLDKELQKITADAAVGRRFVDKLVKVWLRSGEELRVLIHVEVQGNRETGFELRIFVYNYRIFDRYHAPVASFVILTDDDPDWRPAEYRQQLFGTVTSFRFEAVKLLDYEARWAELEASANVFAVVVMAHLRILSTRRDAQARLNWKLQLTKLLYERGYDKLRVAKLFKFLDWLMWLPKEEQREYRDEMVRYEEEKQMEYVTTIERMGIEQGSCRQLLRVLRARFGAAAEAVLEKLVKLNVEQLDALTDKALSAQSLEEFIAALPQVEETEQA